MIMDETFWDEMYAGRDRNWSGNANPVLVQQVSDLAPGRALDVGCGEGDDARWLAAKGWAVTASDISSVALDRAASLTERDAPIDWVHADYLASPPPAGSFDLVSVHFFAIPTARSEAARGIADAVAPGGVLLVVGHAVREGHTWNGIDPSDFIDPHGFGEMLGDEFTVDIDDTRERTTAPPEGSGHTHDTVLRARRHRVEI